MPFFSHSASHSGVIFGGPLRSVATIRSQLMRCYQRYRQRRNLAELDDHLLRDIGLTREQVAAECRKPFWR